MADHWDPQRYDRFEEERSRPFFDLLSYVHPSPNMRILDLGCGTAKLTATAHVRLGAASTLAIDTSAAMLAEAPDPLPTGMRTRESSIEAFEPDPEGYDLVLSNAALHWVADHPTLFVRACSWLRAGGRLAVQMPANEPHASHTVANETAAQPEFATALDGYQRHTPVLDPSTYQEVLRGAGMESPRSEYRTYHHELASSGAVVDWVRGTLLTDFQKRMPPQLYDTFVERYRDAFLKAVGESSPYTFSFRRIFVTARKPR